jgi:hypothetical protein
MAIEISKDTKKEAVASIERYFQQNMDERIYEIDIEVHEAEFQYWRKYERQKKVN